MAERVSRTVRSLLQITWLDRLSPVVTNMDNPDLFILNAVVGGVGVPRNAQGSCFEVRAITS